MLLRYSGLCQTITPRMCTWIADIPKVTGPENAGGRIMLGVESMSLQGFPLSWILGPGTPEKVSNTLLLDMAGNAFSSSMFGAVSLAMLAELPPIDELPANTAGDGVESIVESMLDLMPSPRG